MKIAEETERGFVILRPDGRLDSKESPDLEAAMLGAFERGDKDLVIDLSDVPYISSRGLRVFLIGAKKAAAVEGRLAVCSLQEFVQHAFEITGFLKLFGVFGSRTEAIDSFQDESGARIDPNVESR